ncbi:uncharacterized protein LOC118461253 [Anopheles albimanus]|uniref:uncharacterized protein LOC118461253 n=1 Tax=Anopheles albimanus TaxID=7167 RepID=UPI00163F9A52|nr:uncharacterized protein LOC118461253 [Anopheles albimanus]
MRKEITEEMEDAPVMVIMTRRQKKKMQQDAEHAKSAVSPPAHDTCRPDDIDPHTADLMNLPSAEEDVSREEMISQELYDEFDQNRSGNAIELSKIRFVRKMEDDPSRYRIVILNSRSVHSEISKIWSPAHGLKDYTSQCVVHVPEAKILGVILEGKGNSLINSTLFFERFHQCLLKLEEMTGTDREIPILSFKRIRQFEIFEMMQNPRTQIRFTISQKSV